MRCTVHSEMQTKVREASSNDPWGPSGGQMNDIAQATYNQQDFIEIIVSHVILNTAYFHLYRLMCVYLGGPR